MEFLFQLETYSQLVDRLRESSDDADMLCQVPLSGKILHAEVSIVRQAKRSYITLEIFAICPKFSTSPVSSNRAIYAWDLWAYSAWWPKYVSHNFVVH